MGNPCRAQDVNEGELSSGSGIASLKSELEPSLNALLHVTLANQNAILELLNQLVEQQAVLIDHLLGEDEDDDDEQPSASMTLDGRRPF